MKNFNFTNISQDLSFNHSNITSDIDSDHDDSSFVITVVSYIIFSIGLPLILMAIYAVYTLVRHDHVVPIYVINLLVCDLIQLCSLFVLMTQVITPIFMMITTCFYFVSLVASVCFMVCIALERYLVIACPLWYRFRRNIKVSVLICVLIWVFSPVFVFTLPLWASRDIHFIIGGIYFLLPLPLFIFFLVGTLRALSGSHVPSDEKRRIVGILVLVLLIYALLFLPIIVWFLAAGNIKNLILADMSDIFLQLSPLANCCLYIFMRKGIVDKLLAFVCCCRMDSHYMSTTESNEISTSTV